LSDDLSLKYHRIIMTNLRSCLTCLSYSQADFIAIKLLNEE